MWLLSHLMDAYVNDEQVQPQPARFYGGWITSDIVGLSGCPGTGAGKQAESRDMLKVANQTYSSSHQRAAGKMGREVVKAVAQAEDMTPVQLTAVPTSG